MGDFSDRLIRRSEIDTRQTRVAHWYENGALVRVPFKHTQAEWDAIDAGARENGWRWIDELFYAYKTRQLANGQGSGEHFIQLLPEGGRC